MAPPSDFTPPGGAGPSDPGPDATRPVDGPPPAGPSPYGPPPGGPSSPYGTPPASAPYGSPGGQPPPQDPYQQQPGYQAPNPWPYGAPGAGGYQAEPPPFQQPGYQQPGYQQPYYSAYRLPRHSGATTALVLGLVGLIGAVLFCGIPILASPFAWYIGGQAVREIDSQPGRWEGRDQARAGQIMGIIGTALLVLAVLFFLFFIVLLGASSTS